MPELRGLGQQLVRQGRIKPMSFQELWRSSRRQLCTRLSEETAEELKAGDEKEILVFAEDEIPYESVLKVDFENKELGIPTWAWEGVEQEIMLAPYATSSGRSHYLATINSLPEVTPGVKRDPWNRKPITGPSYENWNLQKDIEDFIFDRTGFTMEELQNAQVAEHLARAEEFEEKDDHKAAKEEYLAALAVQPNNLDILKDHIINLIYLGELDEVLFYSNRILTLSPNDFSALANRAAIFTMMENNEAALKDIDKILFLKRNEEDKEDYFLNLVRRADLLSNLHRYGEALLVWDEVLSYTPDDFEALLGRANSLFHLSRYAESLASVEDALELEPEDDSALALRAVVVKFLSPLSTGVGSSGTSAESGGGGRSKK